MATFEMTTSLGGLTVEVEVEHQDGDIDGIYVTAVKSGDAWVTLPQREAIEDESIWDTACAIASEEAAWESIEARHDRF